jgi:hypothetical protein
MNNADGVHDFKALRKSTGTMKLTHASPMLFTASGHNIWFEDLYKGKSAFLILGGPSFANIDKTKLDAPGVMTMGVNNSVRSYRPKLWTCVDNPLNFIKSIWVDPSIQKFIPYNLVDKNIFDNINWKIDDIKVKDTPNTFFYRRNASYDPNTFMTEDTFNWGNSKTNGGGRSVMLVAIRLLYYLGFRKVFLLGADFEMSETKKYHFEQDRSKSSINGNNSTYKMLIDRFTELKPTFDSLGFEVYNCNPTSKLTIFPFIDFNQAIKLATSEMPDVNTERTAGMYEKDFLKKTPTLTDDDKKAIQKKIDFIKSELKFHEMEFAALKDPESQDLINKLKQELFSQYELLK